MVDGVESLMAAVTSGVPLESVIGPTLFLYYNDSSEYTKSTVALFADDTIIYNTTQKPPGPAKRF